MNCICVWKMEINIKKTLKDVTSLSWVVTTAVSVLTVNAEMLRLLTVHLINVEWKRTGLLAGAPLKFIHFKYSSQVSNDDLRKLVLIWLKRLVQHFGKYTYMLSCRGEDTLMSVCLMWCITSRRETELLLKKYLPQLHLNSWIVLLLHLFVCRSNKWDTKLDGYNVHKNMCLEVMAIVVLNFCRNKTHIHQITNSKVRRSRVRGRTLKL